VGDEGSGPAPADFFAGFPDGLAVFRAVEQAIGELGAAEVAVMKSQIRFRRRTAFAYVWRPGRYVRNDVPAVLSIALPHEVASPRFAEVVHPSKAVWMHHLELREPAQVDDEVGRWLAEAYAAAG
jgi:hypothetical protein